MRFSTEGKINIWLRLLALAGGGAVSIAPEVGWGMIIVAGVGAAIMIGHHVLDAARKPNEFETLPRLKASFRMNDPKCVHETGLGFRPHQSSGTFMTTSQAQYPPYANIGLSGPAVLISTPNMAAITSGDHGIYEPLQPIRLFRIEVKSLNGSVYECNGRMTSFERIGLKHTLPIELPFAMTEDITTANKKPSISGRKPKGACGSPNRGFSTPRSPGGETTG